MCAEHINIKTNISFIAIVSSQFYVIYFLLLRGTKMSLEKFTKSKGLRTDEARRCPIATLAGKSQCLGPACGWHTPGTNTGCMIIETSQLALNAAERLIEIQQNLNDLQGAIHEQLCILKKSTKQMNASKEGTPDDN